MFLLRSDCFQLKRRSDSEHSVQHRLEGASVCKQHTFFLSNILPRFLLFKLDYLFHNNRGWTFLQNLQKTHNTSHHLDPCRLVPFSYYVYDTYCVTKKKRNITMTTNFPMLTKKGAEVQLKFRHYERGVLVYCGVKLQARLAKSKQEA